MAEAHHKAAAAGVGVVEGAVEGQLPAELEDLGSGRGTAAEAAEEWLVEVEAAVAVGRNR